MSANTNICTQILIDLTGFNSYYVVMVIIIIIILLNTMTTTVVMVFKQVVKLFPVEILNVAFFMKLFEVVPSRSRLKGFECCIYCEVVSFAFFFL